MRRSALRIHGNPSTHPSSNPAIQQSNNPPAPRGTPYDICRISLAFEFGDNPSKMFPENQ